MNIRDVTTDRSERTLDVELDGGCERLATGAVLRGRLGWYDYGGRRGGGGLRAKFEARTTARKATVTASRWCLELAVVGGSTLPPGPADLAEGCVARSDVAPPSRAGAVTRGRFRGGGRAIGGGRAMR